MSNKPNPLATVAPMLLGVVSEIWLSAALEPLNQLLPKFRGVASDLFALVLIAFFGQTVALFVFLVRLKKGEASN